MEPACAFCDQLNPNWVELWGLAYLLCGTCIANARVFPKFIYPEDERLIIAVVLRIADREITLDQFSHLLGAQAFLDRVIDELTEIKFVAV